MTNEDRNFEYYLQARELDYDENFDIANICPIITEQENDEMTMDKALKKAGKYFNDRKKNK